VSDPNSSVHDAAPEASASLINRVCDTLGISTDAGHASLRDELGLIARAYLRNKVPPEYASAKAQRRALRKLLKSVERSLVDMTAVAAEYVVALDFAREPGGENTLETAREALFQLHLAISRFDERYRPSKGPAADLALEEAVRDLCLRFEDLIGEPVRARLNKHMDCEPELASAGARAIGILLQGVDPSLSHTKIGHMIEKVYAQPEPSLTNLDILIRINPDMDLDLSLLTARRGTKGIKI
jgi:hypothetical protein